MRSTFARLILPQAKKKVCQPFFFCYLVDLNWAIAQSTKSYCLFAYSYTTLHTTTGTGEAPDVENIVLIMYCKYCNVRTELRPPLPVVWCEYRLRTHKCPLTDVRSWGGSM